GRIPRDLAEGLLKHADCDDLLPLLDRLFAGRAESSPRRVYTNLPRRNPGFRGRENEMAELLKRLSPESRAAVIVIYGLGGIGKTTLATEAGHACLPGGEANLASLYEAVVFISARDRALTLTDILDEIGRVLDYPAILRQSPSEKIPLVKDVLERFKVLLVIDNFETIDDPALTRFAVEGVPAPSKVVITTRDYHPTLWPGTWPVQLKGLGDAEAVQLVREWAQDYQAETIMAASEAELEPLLRATEGNPHALLTALGLIAAQKRPLATVLRDLWAGRGRIFDYIFNRGWDVLSEDARHILMVMPFFVESASPEALGAAAGVEGYHLDRAIGQLVEMSLLEVDDAPEESQRRYRAHPLTLAFATARLDEAPGWEQGARERWSDYFVEYVELYGDDNLGEEIIYRERLRNEIKNLRVVMEWCFLTMPRKAVRLIERTGALLATEGEWLERFNLISRALEVAQQIGMPASQASLLSGVAWSYLIQGDYQQAQKAMDQGLKIAQQHGLQKRLVQFLRDLGWLHSLQGDYSQAYQLFIESLELAERIGYEFGTLHARAFLARIAYKSGYYSEAEQIFLVLLPKVKESYPSMLYILRWLGEMELAEGKLDKARSYLVDMANALKLYYDADTEVRFHENWGDLEKATGHLDKAIEAYKKALDLATRLGMWKEVEQLEALIQESEDLLAKNSPDR
ncbi:MAG: tetratricopeptide repeat protein, partial [Chloroflexi bacterium]|nr:tetratricopeptide repeat protein [Chloroflexota bacterium]